MSDAEDNSSPRLESVPDPEFEEYVEEEVEVTDYENDVEEETAKIPLTPPTKPKQKQKGSATRKSSGRVAPSSAVMSAPMESPESLEKKKVFRFSDDRNPFPSYGSWNVETIGKIDIAFPILTGKNETTNELTRSSRPEARYWKAPISFKYSNFTSETLRFDNVHIPFHTGKGYGDSYVYLCLPGAVGAAFAEAGKRNAPTKIVENSLMPDKERWWKIANKVEGLFGVINNSTNKFHSKSLSTIFDATQAGVSCTVVLRFFCKASTGEKDALRPTTARTVAVEMVKGYITATDVNVQLPTRVSRARVKVDPVATSRDVASDSLLQRLADLGL